MDTERIENRERMVSGRMRSKHIADKYTFSTSWEMLPSRSRVGAVNLVADGYASANDLSDFYVATKGAFIVKIYADSGDGAVLTPGGVFGTYSVFFEDFSMELSRRGKDFDFYDVSITLEEA
jgi:hypothetical protein